MFLRNIWYFALPSADIAPGKLVGKTLLGEPVVFGRTKSGETFALRDICPHRGVPLSAGRFVDKGDRAAGDTVDGPQIECPYHGWRFGKDGACAAIPSLVPGQDFDLSKIRVQKYFTEERQGNIWIYMPQDAPLPGQAPAAPATAPPVLPGVDATAPPRLRDRMTFACHIDHAVIGLMDPAHGPFVHKAWWWRSEASIHEKAKKFAPNDTGFTMVAHAPSSNSGAYKILGGKPVTEIAFRLPGVRTEHIQVGKHSVLGLTTVTPLEEEATEVTQTFYWTNPVWGLMKPIFAPMARTFLRQDHDMVMLQREGLKHNPRLMLINDSDMQAKWYFRLKKTWDDAQEAGEAFVNPVKEATLRWRS
ncbi:MAG: aromatic ring-hydroxylating dioxygenase subunit alpha [Pseudomonadota bacterium]